jgi:hypothetical protein
VSTVDLSGLVWRKSSRSTVNGTNSNCVEVAFAGPTVAVRDSKNPSGDASPLTFPARAFVIFVRLRVAG